MPSNPIPEKYYVEDEMEDSEAVTVYAGDKHFVSLETTKENSQIRFDYVLFERVSDL